VLIRIDADPAQRLARALRANDPPIVARVERDAVVLDLRTVDPADDETVLAAVLACR
jgi:L-seryl-tRNA(Ser) seleniumtransferase